MLGAPELALLIPIAGMVLAGVIIVAIPLNDLILGRLRAMVETVRWRDPFVAANADRLQAIAWALLALQLISIVIGAVADAISTPAFPLHLDASTLAAYRRERETWQSEVLTHCHRLGLRHDGSRPGSKRL